MAEVNHLCPSYHLWHLGSWALWGAADAKEKKKKYSLYILRSGRHLQTIKQTQYGDTYHFWWEKCIGIHSKWGLLPPFKFKRFMILYILHAHHIAWLLRQKGESQKCEYLTLFEMLPLMIHLMDICEIKCFSRLTRLS